MDYKILKIDLNTKLQYYFTCIIFPLGILPVVYKIFSLSNLTICCISILVSLLVVYFLYSLSKHCNNFLMINEDTIRVCKKHNGAIKILKELKKNDVKSVGYMSSSIVATTKEKERIYLLKIYPNLAVVCSLNAVIVLTFVFKFLLFQSRILNKLNAILDFDYKKENIFTKIFSYLINVFFWLIILYNLFGIIVFMLNSINSFI